LPLPQVATWSALPPATTAEVGRRVQVTGPGGWLVAHCIAAPTPRWEPAADSDTGWRDITALTENNGETGKAVRVRRVGSTVRIYLFITNANITSALRLIATGGWPGGFKPVHTAFGVMGRNGGNTPPQPQGLAVAYEFGLYYRLSSTSPISGEWSYTTDAPWPTTLPGTPI
jgi:hypothetical protein